MRQHIALVAMTSLIVSPASASVRDAAFSSSAGQAVTQTSMFAGATYRVGFDRRANMARGRTSLNFGGMVKSANSSNMHIAQGLEITGGKAGKPSFLLAGQDVGRLKEKAELNGSGTALIVGGVILLVVVGGLLALDAHRDNKCSDGPDECT